MAALARVDGLTADGVGEAGTALSGGERQRVSIARALLARGGRFADFWRHQEEAAGWRL